MSAATMAITDLMQRPVVTIAPDATVKQAFDTARENGVHHLPVCADQRLLGTICTCDLHEAKLGDSIRDIMRKPVVTISPDKTGRDAAKLMQVHGVGSVVVVTDAMPSGIVTRGDILERDEVAGDALEGTACECCGTIRHLFTQPDGRVLCVECQDRATNPQGFEVGGSG